MKNKRYTGIAILLALLLSLQGIMPYGPAMTVNAVAKELAAKPYMGWSTFSLQVYDNSVPWVSEEEIKKQSDAMKEKLSQYGYEYINIDAGWNSDIGDEWGRPQPSIERYPNGFENLARYVHNNGQKIGLYRIPGLSKSVYSGTVYTMNPNNNRQYENMTFDGSEDRPIYRSEEVFGREIMLSEILARDENGKPIDMDHWGYTFKIDFSKDGAQLYIDSVVDVMKSWGVDFIKFDSVMPGSDFGDSRSCIDEVKAYGEACERNHIWLEISWAVDRNYAHLWKEYANGWRIEHDVEAYRSIQDYGAGARMVNWENIERLFPMQARWWDVAGPGGWNDFDSLNVGNGQMNGLTEDERKLATTFWAVSAAQFYIGDDMTRLDEYGLSLLTNQEVIAVNQAGHPARPVDKSYEVWYANNGDGTFHVALFNLGKQEKNITVNWSDIGLSGDVKVRDLWAGEDLGGYADSFTVKLNSHAAGLYKVTAGSGTALINDTDNYMTYDGDWHKDEGKQQLEAAQDVTLRIIDSAQQDADSLVPAEAVYLRGTSEAETGISVNIPSDNILEKITNAGQELTAGSDYTVNGSRVVISADYLKRQTAERVNLKFIFALSGANTETIIETVNDSDPAIQYYKNISGFGYSSNRNDEGFAPNYNLNRDVHYSDHADECAIFTFQGTGVSFLTETYDNYADFAVYIDGVRQAGSFTANTPGGSRACQVEGFKVSNLSPGEHTIRIENLSEGKYLNIDGFIVEPAPGEESVTVNDTDPAIQYYRIVKEAWEYSNNRENYTPKSDYNLDLHISDIAGEYMTYSFTGTGISFLTEQMDQAAAFEAHIDGVKQPGLFMTDNGGPRECQVPAFKISDLPYGEHTIKIVNASGGYLYADAFEIEKPKGAEQPLTIYMVDPSSYEMVNDTDSAIQYTGAWGHSGSRGLGDYEEDVHYTEEQGAEVTYTFTGTGVAYLSEQLNEVGQFEVFLDGESMGIHDAYEDLPGERRKTQQILYQVSDLAYGRHTIKLVKIDGQYLQVDAFRVETPDLVMPNAFIYDKNAPAQEIRIFLQGNEDFFRSLNEGKTVLSAGRDYALSGDTLQFSPEYLNGLAAGEHTVKVSFDGDYYNDLHWTNEDGASCSYTFIGSGVKLIGPVGPEFGSINIYLDGILKGTADAYHDKRLVKQSLYTIDGLAKGAHTIKLVKAGGSVMAFDALAFDISNGTDPVQAERLYLDKSQLSMKVGETKTLTASVEPAAANKDLTWSTSDAGIVSVSSGNLTAKANGTAAVTVKTSNGKTAVCQVTVTTDVAKVEVKSSLTVPKGKTKALGAAVLPATASNKALRYRSSDTKVVRISAKGVVTGVGKGTATITVTAANGKKAGCKVTVAEVKLNTVKTVLQVGKSTTAIKAATKYPAKDTVASYQSSNTKIATVTAKGKITGKKTGKVKITITMKSGAAATCKLTVQKAKVVTKSLKFSKKSYTIRKGSTTVLSLARNPVTATEKLTWTSSNKKVVAVSGSGKVTAKAKGTVTITVKSSNGKRAVCKVTVPQVKLNAAKTVLQTGKSTTAIKIASRYPKKDTIKSYKSSNTAIAAVTAQGKITGKKPGKVKITITMKSGASAVCSLTVQNKKVVTKSLSMSGKVTVKRGKTVTLKVTKNPVTATEKLTWVSSNKKIATVKNGKVKGIKAGKATITVKSSNGKKKTCMVTVSR